MRFLLFVLLPFALLSFESKPITPHPVIGFRKIAFFDKNQNIERDLLFWYPVDPEIRGTPSPDPWDVFDIALDAQVANQEKKRPLIVISHGYTGNPHQLSWLIRGFVHAGFIVAGIQHRDLINGRVHINHWRRAEDIRTLINLIPADSPIDAGRIGIAGFSLGGTTAIWIAGGRSTKLKTLIPGQQYASPEDFVRADEALPTLNKEMMAKDWGDSRVRAAFIMAPAWAWLFEEQSLNAVSIPVYLIAAEADPVLVTRNNAGFFARNIPLSIYQEIPGKAGHYIFISALNEKQQKKADLSRELNFLFEDDITIDRSWIQFEVVNEAVRFFREMLK